MSAIKTALLAGGLVISLATAASAQAAEAAKTDKADVGESWNLDSIPEGTGVMMATSKAGKATKMKIGKKGHAQLLAARAAIELPPKTMIYKKNGKLYLVGDKRMPDNTMLFDKTKGWDGD
jgi:hypothetical protein